MNSPIQQIKTCLDWDDLELTKIAKVKIEKLQRWEMENNTSADKKKRYGGYKVLFTGKGKEEERLAAALIGKQFNKEVYRIDTILLFTRFADQAQKQLSELFNKAEKSSLLLFFDNADLLFDKTRRTSEIYFLLQQFADYNGLILVGINNEINDPGLVKFMDSIIEFPLPLQQVLSE